MRQLSGALEKERHRHNIKTTKEASPRVHFRKGDSPVTGGGWGSCPILRVKAPVVVGDRDATDMTKNGRHDEEGQ